MRFTISFNRGSASTSRRKIYVPADLTARRCCLCRHLITVRLGQKRSLARKTTFDAVLLVILASVLSRAINGSAAFFATLGGGLVLVLLHRLLALIAYHSHWFGIMIKGRPETIVENGHLIPGIMLRNHISKHDLEEDLRLSTHHEDIDRVRLARVERSGDISFIC